MAHPSSEQLEAVFIFQGDELARELLYPEFEAILDGFIPMPEYAGQSIRAVYIRVDRTFTVKGTVFFLLGFDAKGMVDHRWNVPLAQLFDAAGPGPDLGGGPVKLSCYSQCPIAWHQKNLWDPQMQSAANSFVVIRKAVRANRVGLSFKPLPEELNSSVSTKSSVKDLRSLEEFEREQSALQKKLHDRYSQEIRDKMAQLLKEQRLRVSTLINQQKKKVSELQAEHQARLQAYYQKMREMDQQKRELEVGNAQLKDSLDVQINKIEGVREYFAHKLKAAQQDDNSELQGLQENFELELELKVQAATAGLREMLDMREVELFYRHQNEGVLKDEIVSLKRENHELLKHASNQLLGRLTKAGVNFVAYLPGVGEVNIPLDDMSSFIENPQAYAAAKSDVNDALYFSWLEHHQSPCCNALDQRGQPCAKAVAVVASPLEFHPGESDRCLQHQAVSYQLLAERR